MSPTSRRPRKPPQAGIDTPDSDPFRHRHVTEERGVPDAATADLLRRSALARRLARLWGTFAIVGASAAIIGPWEDWGTFVARGHTAVLYVRSPPIHLSSGIAVACVTVIGVALALRLSAGPWLLAAALGAFVGTVIMTYHWRNAARFAYLRPVDSVSVGPGIYVTLYGFAVAMAASLLAYAHIRVGVKRGAASVDLRNWRKPVAVALIILFAVASLLTVLIIDALSHPPSD